MIFAQLTAGGHSGARGLRHRDRRGSALAGRSGPVPEPRAGGLAAGALPAHFAATRTEDEWRLRSRDVAKELWSAWCSSTFASSCSTCSAPLRPHRPVRSCFTASPARTAPASIAALLLALADAEPEATRATTHELGESPRRVSQALRRRPTRSGFWKPCAAPRKGPINAEFLADTGGVRAYLAQIGLREDEIERLRARLRS